MKKNIIISFIILIGCLYTQEVLDERPLSINIEDDLVQGQFSNQRVDNNYEILEDENRPINSPFRYGKKNNVNIDFFSDAKKTEVNGESIWLLKISSPNAYAISLQYNHFQINGSGRFFVYNNDKSILFGAYSRINNTTDNYFSTPLVAGEEIILEYNGVQEGTEIIISEIIHDYRDIMNFSNDDRTRDCGTNPSCTSALPYQNQINATSWLDMGGAICSGSMVNNTEQDLTPYYMTAWHCIDGSSASTYRFYFNYDTNSCTSSNYNYDSYVYGSILRASSGSMDGDFALLEITGYIYDSWDVYYAGWNRYSSNQLVEVGVHHPGGSPKKVNFDNDYATTGNWGVNWYGGGYSPGGSYWEITWDDGGTEGGSSGSPAYDSNGRLIGVLSGGGNACSSSSNGGESYYAKFSYAWNFGSNSSNRLSDWLDPNNTGFYVIDGTYDGIIYGCTNLNACNYNSNATEDNGSCEYAVGTCDCNNNPTGDYCDCNESILDVCGVCGGDGTSCLEPVSLSFGNQSLGSFEIILNSEIDISGFQFEITDSPESIIITGASGGAADANDFVVSTSEGGVILGFSFSGGSIQAGDNMITNIQYEGEGQPELCLSNAIISNDIGQVYPVEYGPCVTISGTAHLSFGEISPGIINIRMQNSQIVAGYQFILADYPDDLNLINTFGGVSEDYGFTISYSENGQILGFDFSGSTIPQGDHLLIQLEVSGIGSPEICIEQGVIAGQNNADLNVSYGECRYAVLTVPGDLNNDGQLNVVDIVNLVNLILYPENQTQILITIGDLNDDEQLNVVDIVNLVGIILDN